MSLYEKMYNVMTESEGLEKDLVVGKGENQYRAVGEKEVLNQLKPLFKKYKLIVFPVSGDISENNSTVESTYNGATTLKARNITQLKCNFKIVDIETGESETLIGFGNGADSQDKGSGKAFTYAYKTMLSKTFMLFSGEDTDNEHSDDIGKTYEKTVVKPVIKPVAKTSVQDTGVYSAFNDDVTAPLIPIKPPVAKTTTTETAKEAMQASPTKTAPVANTRTTISKEQAEALKKHAQDLHGEEHRARCLSELMATLKIDNFLKLKITDMTFAVEFIEMWDSTKLPFTFPEE